MQLEYAKTAEGAGTPGMLSSAFVRRATALLFGVAIALPLASGETSLQLGITWGIRAVSPSRVTVPVGESLTLSPLDLGPVTWFRNGSPLQGAPSGPLVLPSVRESDGGIYWAVYTGLPEGDQASQSVVMSVGPTQRLVNLSTRARIGAGEDMFISGFVVTGNEDKRIIIRAIGPSLSMFGVGDPVQHPAIAIFDSEGKPYTNGYYYPQCVGCPTYEDDLASSLAKTGAFPLPEGSGYVVVMKPFAPGSYTVHVTSADGGSGVALLEIYEVP